MWLVFYVICFGRAKFVFSFFQLAFVAFFSVLIYLASLTIVAYVAVTLPEGAPSVLNSALPRLSL